MTERFPRGVLFDLDGTLLDSAPDMVAAINLLRRDHGLEAMALETLRPHVSKGARAMVRCAFGHLDDAGREALVREPIRVATLECRSQAVPPQAVGLH